MYWIFCTLFFVDIYYSHYGWIFHNWEFLYCLVLFFVREGIRCALFLINEKRRSNGTIEKIFLQLHRRMTHFKLCSIEKCTCNLNFSTEYFLVDVKKVQCLFLWCWMFFMCDSLKCCFQPFNKDIFGTKSPWRVVFMPTVPPSAPPTNVFKELDSKKLAPNLMCTLLQNTICRTMRSNFWCSWKYLLKKLKYVHCEFCEARVAFPRRISLRKTPKIWQ